jgi:hypothetical protein
MESRGGSNSNVSSNDRNEIILQNYNFAPIDPRGRIVGVTSADRQILKRIAQRMERDNLVGTLSTSQRRRNSTSPGEGGEFILRIISFSQAEQRLERSFGNGSRYVQSLKEERDVMVPMKSTTAMPILDVSTMNDDECSLLCCWEYETSWNVHRDRYIKNALLNNYRRYKELTDSSSGKAYFGW